MDAPPADGPARAASPSRADDPPGSEASPTRGFVIAAVVAGMVATAIAGWLLDVLARLGAWGPLSDALFVTPFWQAAVASSQGLLPYRDYPLEYPPLSLPVLLLPGLFAGPGLTEAGYTRGFELVISASAIGLVPIVVLTVVRLGGRRLDVAAATALVAASPLLLGSLAISRYDLWPALLTAGATLAMVAGRFRWAFAILALAVLAKVYPGLLIPIFLAYAWRVAGRREAIIDAAIGAAVGLAGMLPFVAIDAAGALDPFTRFVARPLQVESLGASLLLALHDWLGRSFGHFTYTFFSFNLEGPLPSTVAAVQAVVLIAVLVAIWVAAARGPADPRRLVVACAAVLTADVALGKVLSPQYVLWLVAPIAVLAGVRGVRPLAAVAVVLVLTQLYYPGMYQAYLRFDAGATLAILERNLALVLLALYLARASGVFEPLRHRRRSRSVAPDSA
ncbi:MAG TPA: glycosyltransferase 87 family protein [Candidatus Limnocylindrales bacterium]